MKKFNSPLAILSVILISGFLFCSSAVPTADEVLSLPGWNGSFPSRQYSGYVNVDKTNGRYLHYWFVESENNPAEDPVVLWLNGGPGCSSLDGYFYEQGPFHFVDPNYWNSTEVPPLYLNPHRWNKIANMIFLESPSGVGFSYSDTESDYDTDDDKTAADNLHFLQEFFSMFEEYKTNPFYITGESYAGIYVPTLADLILKQKRNTSNVDINMKGFMVGNGCIGNEVGSCSNAEGTNISVEFLHGHGLYSEKVYEQILSNCESYDTPSQACNEALELMSKQVGRVNIYDIYFPCYSSLPSDFLNSRDLRIPNRLIDKYINQGPIGCIDGGVAAMYLNHESVREAIHVKSIEKIGKWSVCSGKLRYTRNTKSLLPVYPSLIKNYRVLIYNGDVDACVPYNGNEAWTSGLMSKLSVPVKEEWHPWNVDAQVAGYSTSYEMNDFRFVTVKGSGHMVPQFRPKQAYAMFSKFLNNVSPWK